MLALFCFLFSLASCSIGKMLESEDRSLLDSIPSNSKDVLVHVSPFGSNKTYNESPITGEKYVNSTFFEDFNGEIDPGIWQILSGGEHGAQGSKDLSYTKDGFLHLEFLNDPDRGLFGSAIQTRDEFLYGKWEARIKASNAPGVLNSVYTIDWNNTADPSSNNNGTRQEIDIELLNKSFTEAKGEVHFAVHATGKKSYNSNPDFKLDFNPSAGFHVFGFEITPEYIEWFVDGKSMDQYIYSENDIKIDAPYMLKMNNRTGIGWVGGPPSIGTKAIYLIDWIRFTPLNQ